MRKCIVLIVIVIAVLFIGCQEKNPITHDEGENNTVSPVDIYDFAFVKMAPKAKKRHELNDVIKIYLIENDGSLDTGYAVDIKSDRAYIDPNIGSRGIRSSIEESKDMKDSTSLISILKKYNVQDWKTNYSQLNNNGYEDGYGWQFLLQFSDGTVETHSGSGVDLDNITPENFYTFKQDLFEAIEAQIVND